MNKVFERGAVELSVSKPIPGSPAAAAPPPPIKPHGPTKKDRLWWQKKRFILPGALLGVMAIGSAAIDSDESGAPDNLAAVSESEDKEATTTTEEATTTTEEAITTTEEATTTTAVAVNDLGTKLRSQDDLPEWPTILVKSYLEDEGFLQAAEFVGKNEDYLSDAARERCRFALKGELEEDSITKLASIALLRSSRNGDILRAGEARRVGLALYAATCVEN